MYAAEYGREQGIAQTVSGTASVESTMRAVLTFLASVDIFLAARRRPLCTVKK